MGLGVRQEGSKQEKGATEAQRHRGTEARRSKAREKKDVGVVVRGASFMKARLTIGIWTKFFCFFLFTKRRVFLTPAYRPLKSGARFSMNAAMASFESSVLPSSTVRFCSKR